MINVQTECSPHSLRMKRIKIVPDRPNHLFESWLEEWRNEAVLRNSELQKHFTKALDSLRRYPLPLESGKECIILQHFGTKLCSMLDKKLEEYRRQEFTKAVDACFSQTSSNDDRTVVSREKPVEKCKIVEVQEKSSAVAKQVKNTKKNASKRLANANEIASREADRQISLEPSTFDIVLLVDTQETCGRKTKPQHDATLVELTRLGVLFEVRRLKVGDFAWIARCRKTNDELVMPYIIERKRMDDLSASIVDGRFHEQKFRLKQSGIKNLMYIVENIDKNSRFSIPLSSLLQASVNCLVQDSFTVKYTRSHKDSMSHLSCITKILIKIYKNKKLVGCKKNHLTQTDHLGNIYLMEFKEFNKASSKQKTFRVSEMFIRQLLQLKGMSVDKAMAIVECYTSPQILLTALEHSGKNGEQLLANIQVGDKKRRLGPAISKAVYQLYTMNELS
ncbi:crossover junction endonuclease MUS81 isoform X1 [Temnothorax nylanderi]|uniref:crossover junction endonuclease MUS81 isoform X1 n=2 Tax=Temnothorax nylanderi TaxID=102681 RepID=UPI003A83FB6F